MKKWIVFFKNEAVLCISAIAAFISMILVPPDMEYLSYVDMRVIILLFCLMCVVSGLQRIGLLEVLAQNLIVRTGNSKSLCVILILLCFFSSMLLTNDVALITFVPLAISTLYMTGQTRLIPFAVSMQTIAANLGSTLTPLGNPQNLYLYSYYSLSIGTFFKITLPITAIGFLIVTGLSLLADGREIHVVFHEPAAIQNRKNLVVFSVLAVLCIASVLHLIPSVLLLIVVLATVLLMDRACLRQVDFALLLTFVCFFVFVGNVGRIDSVRNMVSDVIAGRELIASVLLSQMIINVPDAVMLSGFTENYDALI